MKERNDIDELFRDTFEDFRPDSSHISDAGITAFLKSKAAAKAAIAGKAGVAGLVGSVVVAAGTIAAVVLGTDGGSGEQIRKSPVMVHAGEADSLEMLTSLTDSLSINGTEADTAFTLSDVFAGNDKFSKETITGEAPAVKNRFVQSGINRARGKARKTIPDVKEDVMSVQKAVAAVPAGLELQTTLTPENTIAVPLLSDTPIAAAATAITAPEVRAIDSAGVASGISGVPDLKAQWPRHRFSVQAGMAYVPERFNTFLTAYYGGMNSDPYKYQSVDGSIKPELLLNAGYQYRMNNGLKLGADARYQSGEWSMSQSGIFIMEMWSADSSQMNYVEDTLVYYSMKSRYTTIGLGVSTGYDFVISDRWMVSANIGLFAQQYSATTEEMDAIEGVYHSSQLSGFLASMYGSADVMYRTGNLGFSLGASLNGRAALMERIYGTYFYNNVSFGAHAGVHYFLKGKAKP